MTKKTNSLVFRYGLNIFWRNKSAQFKSISNILQLENILIKELQTQNLKIVFIYYKHKWVSISVYSHQTNNQSLKYNIVKYFNTVLNWNQVSIQFNISKTCLQFFFNIIQRCQLHILTSNNYHITSYIIWFFFNKYILYSLIINIKKNILHFYNNFSYIRDTLLLLINMPLFITKQSISFNISRFKIRTINGSIKLKVLSLYLENSIVRSCGLFFNISINNVLLQRGLLLQNKIINKYQQEGVYYIFHTLIISILYNNTKIITDYLSFYIKLRNNHQKLLKNFISILNKIYFGRIINMHGLKLRLNGKLNGNMRTSKYNYSLGKVQLQTLNVMLNFNQTVSYTKFGSISIKIWLVYGSSSLQKTI